MVAGRIFISIFLICCGVLMALGTRFFIKYCIAFNKKGYFPMGAYSPIKKKTQPFQFYFLLVSYLILAAILAVLSIAILVYTGKIFLSS